MRLDPEKIVYLRARADDWYAKGEFDKAIVDSTEYIRHQPAKAEGYIGRGAAHSAKREHEKAIADLSFAIHLDPTKARAYVYRGLEWEQQFRWGEALRDFRKATALEPTYLIAQNDLAWILAACPDAQYRDGRAAVRTATKACDISQWKNPLALDTLACALAEAGNFQEAVKRSQQALRAAVSMDKWVTASIQAHLTQFEHRQPYHDTDLASPSAN